MAKVTKTILPPGVYHAPQGRLNATKQRLDRWSKQFRRMKAAGIRVPVCWGHQPGAIPGEGKDKATRQFDLSRFNAGYLEDLRVGPEGLEGVMDIPGAEVDDEGNLLTWAKLPDGRKVQCAIREVSAAIRDWKDGKGREWPDVIMHVALVPLPVVGGQEGFAGAGLGSGADLGFDFDEVPGEIHLGLSNYLHGQVQLSGGDAMPLDEMGGGGALDGGVADPVRQSLGILAKMGLHLPDDTNEGNLCERIYLIGNALDKAGVLNGVGGAGAGAGAGDGDFDDMGGDEMMEAGEDEMLSEGDELPLEDEGLGEDMDEGMENGEGYGVEGEDDLFGDEEDEEKMLADDMDEDDEDGVTVTGDSDGLPGDEDEEEDEDATEEPRPLMMSTKQGRGLVVRTALEKQLVRQVTRGVQRKRLERLNSLVSRGMPRHRAEQMRQEIEATPVQLTLRKGKIVPVESRVDVELSTLESVATGTGWVTSRGQATRAKRPAVKQAGKVSQKFIEEQAASVSTNWARR